MAKVLGERVTAGAARAEGGPHADPSVWLALTRRRFRVEMRRAAGRALAVGAVLTVGLLGARHAAQGAQWDPPSFANQDTLQLRTQVPREGEYWFKVWLVVLDGQVYVRLGSRAAKRVERNATAPYLGVEVGGQRFDKVRAVPVPEMAERVSQAMAEKYTSDFLVRWLPHPLTLRLVPES